MAIYLPTIRNYAPFYIQREADSSAIDIRTTYGVIIMVHEYPSKRKVKTPYKNDWKDRDGDDEWNNVLQYEAFDIKAKCVIFTQDPDSDAARSELRTAVWAFQESIRDGEFKIYDSWTKYGFQKVRLDEFQEIGDGDFDERFGRCRLIFTISFKVNDPITRMTLSDGSIVEV